MFKQIENNNILAEAKLKITYFKEDITTLKLIHSSQ